MKTHGYFISSFLIATYILLTFSCSTTKDLIYLQDVPQTTQASPVVLDNYTEPVIQPNDILAITVTTADPAVTIPINSRNGVYVNGGIPSNGSANPLAGYLVNKKGEVDIPLIGTLKLGGLTTNEAKKVVKDSSAHVFENAVVDIRFTNFKVTLLGEVNHPAAYIIPNEQVSIMDAIGYAGDLTIYGRRTNVLLIRKGPDGKNVSVRMDLTSKTVLNSPYYYLRQNDVVYVEPLKTKVLNNDNNLVKYLSLAATLLTAAIFAKRYF